MPHVSVVVPTRNRSGLLAVALRSALGQQRVGLEILVVDDGSTDDTAAVVARSGGPVRLLRHPEARGVSAARNTGVAAAAADWIAFLDDDDVWAPDKVVRQLSAARRAGRGWAYGGDVTVDERLRILGGAPPPRPERVVADLERHNAVPAGASNVLVRADVLALAGPFDPSLRNNEDWDMWIRLARLGPPACVPRPLVAVRIHPGNASRRMPAMLAELEVIAARHGVPVDWARHYRWAGWASLNDGRRTEAAGYYTRAAARGDVASAGRALIALAAPGIARRRAAAVDPGDPWAAEARRWLRSLAGG